MAEATTLIDQGLVQQLSGRYAAAAANQQQALALFSDLGNLLGQAEAHNNFGQLAIRAANTPQARTHHAQALAIARDISAPLEEARALEGLGQTHLQDGSRDKAWGCCTRHTRSTSASAPRRATGPASPPATDSKHQRPRVARLAHPYRPTRWVATRVWSSKYHLSRNESAVPAETPA